MNPGLRKLALVVHVTASVGWLGAVAAFLVLSVTGISSRDAETVRACYLAMDAVGRFLIVPLSLAALASGLVQSLGTPWRLFRHYWVAAKFVLTIGATFLLLLHQFTAVADAARQVTATPAGTLPELGPLGPRLVGDAALALVVLLTNTVLSVFKPWGRIAEQPAAALRVAALLVGLLLAAIVVLHIAGVSPLHHGMHSHAS